MLKFGPFSFFFCSKLTKIRPQNCPATPLFIRTFLTYAAENRPVRNTAGSILIQEPILFLPSFSLPFQILTLCYLFQGDHASLLSPRYQVMPSVYQIQRYTKYFRQYDDRDGVCRTCLREALWCDGIQQCPDDEKGCPSLSGVNAQQREMILYSIPSPQILPIMIPFFGLKKNKLYKVLFKTLFTYFPKRLNALNFLKLNSGNPR